MRSIFKSSFLNFCLIPALLLLSALALADTCEIRLGAEQPTPFLTLKRVDGLPDDSRVLPGPHSYEISLNRGVASNFNIIGEPDSSFPWTAEREVIAARYFSIQLEMPLAENGLSTPFRIFDVSMGGAAYIASRATPRDPCPDVVARNRLTGKYSLGEGKGVRLERAFRQFKDAIVRLGGLQKIDELVIAVPAKAISKWIWIDDEGYLLGREHDQYTGIIESKGKTPILRTLPKSVAMNLGMKRIKILVVRDHPLEAESK